MPNFSLKNQPLKKNPFSTSTVLKKSSTPKESLDKKVLPSSYQGLYDETKLEKKLEKDSFNSELIAFLQNPTDEKKQMIQSFINSISKQKETIKLILVIAGHGLCETIICNSGKCITSEETHKIVRVEDGDKVCLQPPHTCGEATLELHNSSYVINKIHLYSYAPYGISNVSHPIEVTSGDANMLYYNKFSRIYSVNKEIESILRNSAGSQSDFNRIMTLASADINSQEYIDMLKRKCDKYGMIIPNIIFKKQSLVKEVYTFDNERSDNEKFTSLQPLQEDAQTSWYKWIVSFMNSGKRINEYSHDIFSGIFVVHTDKPILFDNSVLLPNRKNNNRYGLDLTLFDHIESFCGAKLCILILKYIKFWNKFISSIFNDDEVNLLKCNININLIKLNIRNIDIDRIGPDQIDVIRALKIMAINNESLYHIINIILNFKSNPNSDLIAILMKFFDFFDMYTNSELYNNSVYVTYFKCLLDFICPLFNVELHVASNTCRSLEDRDAKGFDYVTANRELEELQAKLQSISCAGEGVGGGGKNRRKNKNKKKTKKNRKGKSKSKKGRSKSKRR